MARFSPASPRRGAILRDGATGPRGHRGELPECCRLGDLEVFPYLSWTNGRTAGLGGKGWFDLGLSPGNWLCAPYEGGGRPFPVCHQVLSRPARKRPNGPPSALQQFVVIAGEGSVAQGRRMAGVSPVRVRACVSPGNICHPPPLVATVGRRAAWGLAGTAAPSLSVARAWGPKGDEAALAMRQSRSAWLLQAVCRPRPLFRWREKSSSSPIPQPPNVGELPRPAPSPRATGRGSRSAGHGKRQRSLCGNLQPGGRKAAKVEKETKETWMPALAGQTGEASPPWRGDVPIHASYCVYLPIHVLLRHSTGSLPG